MDGGKTDWLDVSTVCLETECENCLVCVRVSFHPLTFMFSLLIQLFWLLLTLGGKKIHINLCTSRPDTVCMIYIISLISGSHMKKKKSWRENMGFSNAHKCFHQSLMWGDICPVQTHAGDHTLCRKEVHSDGICEHKDSVSGTKAFLFIYPPNREMSISESWERSWTKMKQNGIILQQ